MPTAMSVPRDCGPSARDAGRSSGARRSKRRCRSARKCGYHFRIDALTRLRLLFDDGEFEEYDETLVSTDPLGFSTPSHTNNGSTRCNARTDHRRMRSISAGGLLNGRESTCARSSCKFIGGSMGSVVGEKITRAIERAIAHKAPLIIISASGGARMQEGAVSLMQLAKISAALMRLDEAGVPYISVLTDPTTGGVTASFAMLGDLNIAEPERSDRFCGSSRHRADDPPKAAGRLPEEVSFCWNMASSMPL